jgi:hypothetical protein
MSNAIVSNADWEFPESRPIDEAVWRAWILKGIANERRLNARLLKVAKGIAIGALIAASSLWSQVTPPTETIAKFIVAVASVVVVTQAFGRRQYAVGAVFFAMVLMFNPVLRIFEFSGQWQHAFVAGAAVLFSASFVWPRSKLVPNV